jgi:hypothetical protein
MSGCYRLITTYTEISNNRYIFNNDYTNISFGLYNNSNNNYLITGVPKNYPLTFFSPQRPDITNIINFEPINSEPINIYVSKGQDVSFNNGDYFRFYDTSYQLLNINHGYRRTYDSSLTDIRSNFYFMNNRSYKFIAIRDFCSNFPFHIGSNSLTYIDNSFILKIPDNANNSSNKIFYRDGTSDISGNLYILKDLSGLQYNYGDISFSISNYSNIDSSNIKISIKSYDFSYGSQFSNFGKKEISNNNYLYYSPICDYIINNSLALNNEYLNKVSAIDISGNCSLLCSFNKGRHLNSNNNVYDLSFVLTDGSYIIIDVPLNYPLRLLNNNVSNSIYIDTSYQPSRIKSYRNSTNNQVYYHGSFKIKVLANFFIVGVEIYNRLTNNPTRFNSKFIYTDNNHTNNNGTYGTVNTSVLSLKNQKDMYYVYDDYNVETNIYNLKLDEKYVEKGYSALDKYGNDLAIKNFVKVVPSSLESIDREITNTINSRLSAYNILYEVRDYEDNLIQNIRKIEINYGPIIEISSNYFNTNNIYRNSNQNNNTLIFQNNTFNPGYEFFENIKVYIYDVSKVRINIPFEIDISGTRFTNTLLDTLPIRDISSLSYTVNRSIGSNGPNGTNNLVFPLTNGKNYYAYYNKNIAFYSGNSNDTINIKNIDNGSIVYSNTTSNLYRDNTTNINTTSIPRPIAYELPNSILLGEGNVILKNVVQSSLDSSNIILSFDLSYAIINPLGNHTLTTNLKINNYSFEIDLISTNISDNLNIRGNFKSLNIFTNSTSSGAIDISYVGNYDVNIVSKGLSSADYFYNTYSNRFFKTTLSDTSRNYKIIIQDISSPVLNFYNIVENSKPSTYLHYLSRNNTFNILHDICFVDVRTIQNYGNFISSYVYNTPIIEYRDDSIYALNYTKDISFTRPVNSNISIENNVVALQNKLLDTSCIILYRGKDICNNLSQDISLVLNFVSIPKVELSGNIVLDISYISPYTSYKDSGIKIYRNNDNIDTNFIFFDPPQGITRNVSYSTSRSISSTTYDISYITDLCQNLIGNYYFNYTIRIQNNTSSYPLNLRRLVRIIDNERPSFLFHDLSLISYKLNATNMTNYDSNYRNFPNRRIAYTNSNFNIDLSFTINRTFDDLSKVLYDFSATDNYFSPSTILKQIRLINNYTPLTYNDISNYFNNEKRFNRVTVGRANTNTLPPLTFIYTILDLCSNIATAQRIVNIIDDSLPSIDFSFNNYYNSINNPNYNYKYVYFNPSSYTDFSYVAFNYSKSNTTFDFIQELSSILFNYNLSDTFSNGNINYRITISNDSIESVINNVTDLSANTTVKNFFSTIDTSFTIVYDISDNQYNTSRTTRRVKIIDLSYNLDISFLNNSRNLTISFGDTRFNILQDVSFNHRRLTSSDISFDISYNFTSTTITTVSGATSILYDPSALIYNVGMQTVNYFPSYYTSTNYSIERYINVTNYGPIINYLPSGEIIHEVYTPITDASLLFNVTSDSIYDRFYYQNNKHPLVYNGTNFKVTYDTSLNLLGPSFGTYNIFYNSRDLNGVNTSKRRSLRVIDSSPPNLTLSGDSIYNIIGNTYYIPNGKYYIEHGAYGYDVGSRTYIPDISISKVYERNTNVYTSETPNFVTISYEYFNTYQLIFSEDIVNYRITYSATDICNNTAEIIRNIIVSGSKKPILEPYIEVSDMCNNVRTYPLSSDISINSQLRNTLTNTLTNTLYDSTIYDLSLVSSISAQYILCEAVLQNVFYKVKTNNYIKFKLNAKKYDGTELNSEYKNVDYSINSINIYEDQTVTFFARDISRDPIDQISFIEYTLRFIDSKSPLVNLLGNETFENINILNYPLLQISTINKLANVNINYFDNFNNIYNNYERYYKKSLDNYIVIVDPGINITDLAHGRVNYINGAFSSVINYQHTFDITDISINYNRLNQSYYIDVCNLLIEDTCYNQNYRVSDRNQNIADISRIINVSRFPPIINLNYQADCCNNKYITHLHKLYEIYQDLGGNVKDYFDDTINFANVVITNNINENQTGTYNILYDVSNSAPLSNRGVRNVEVINTLQLQENLSYNFSDISNPSNNTKYSLANGIYKLDVSINNAFNIIVREFDISLGNYDISNIVSITSDNSLNNSSNKKYYYNNVVLTISGDFNRLSLEFANNQPTIRNMFVYNNENSYLDVANHIENTKNNVFIHKSYDLDISNLNVLPNIKPFYVLNDTLNNSAVSKNLHLSIGNYRFYQKGYKNFHNPIKFSITKDGTHNAGIEYTKNIFRKNIAGVSILDRYTSYTQINIDATTPSTLYYYCENFPNMGGMIQTKNNIIFSKDAIILNNNVIDQRSEIKILETNYPDNVLLRNRIILTQKFAVSGGDLSYINISCITQQNIQHNILYNLKQLPDKIIIRAHKILEDRTDLSVNLGINSIISNNVGNYLVETKKEGYNFSNTYIRLFKYDFDTSFNVDRKEANPSLNIYNQNIKDIFYNHKNYNFIINDNKSFIDEILNYSDFFRKNHILVSSLIADSFEYKIADFFFIEPSKILNLDNEYDYNEKLVAPRIKITNITSNYVTFILEIYYNTNNNWYIPSRGAISNRELLFGTYEYIIYSDKLKQIFNNSTEASIRNFITFYDGSITITNNLIYSQNSDLSNVYYDSRIIDNVSNNVDTSNIIFLSINDITNNNSVCGLTKKNFYNNISFDDNKRLIFYKYNQSSIVNYQVNSPQLLLQDTLREYKNEDNYLIDICSNDIYNFYKEQPLSYTTLSELSHNEEYNVYIAFNIQNELSNNNSYLSTFDIGPIYLNNIPMYRAERAIYRGYSTIYNYDRTINAINELSYNDFSNNLSSNSYILDLNDYFDISIFKNTLNASDYFSTDAIDKNKLKYKLLDISYIKSFNIYDLSRSESIVFNVTNLNLLIEMRNKILPMYFKLIYMIKLLIITDGRLENENIALYFSNDDSINYYIKFITIDPNNRVVDYYTNEVSVATLNSIYKEIFMNTKILLGKFENIIRSYNVRNSYIIPILNFLTMVIDFKYLNLDYLNNVIDLLESNIQNILDSKLLLLSQESINSQLSLYGLTNNISFFGGALLSYEDISYINYCFKNFYVLNNYLDIIMKEVYIKQYNYAIIFESYRFDLAYNTSSESFKKFTNLYAIKNMTADILYEDLKENFKLLNNNLNLHYSYGLKNYVSIINYDTVENNIGSGPATNHIIAELSYNELMITNYETLYINVKRLYNIITEVYEIITTNYRFRTLYINRSYELQGSSILINSYYSNSISIRFNVSYVKSLYYTIDLSNIILDVSIPDLTPPTVIFTNNDISFNENVFNSDASVNYIVTNKLLNDITYVDLHQIHNFSLDTTTIKYNRTNTDTDTDTANNIIRLETISYSLIEIDLTQGSNITFGEEISKNIYITYTLLDNANNKNIVKRKVTIFNDLIEPIFYYDNNFYNSNDSQIENRKKIIIERSILENAFISILRSSVLIYQPKIHETPLFLNEALRLDISYIKIKDDKIPIIKYYNRGSGFIDYNDSSVNNFSALINNFTTISNNIILEYISSIENYRIQGEFEIILQLQPLAEIEAVIDSHCCYPKVYYKPIQDNYKLGSQNSAVMRTVKYIINRHI